MAFLFGFNLSDAGDFQKNLDHEHGERLTANAVILLSRHTQLISLVRGEEAQALNIIKKRMKLRLFDFEVGFPAEEMDIKGMIVASFDHKPLDRGIIEGERYSHRELTQSPVTFVLYKPLEEDL